MAKRRTASAISQSPAQTAKRQPDGSIAITLSDRTAVTLRTPTGRDLARLDDDDWLILSRLITKWGDRVPEEGRSIVMSDEFVSAGFLDISDALLLKSVISQLFAPDIDSLSDRTEVEDLGKDGLRAILPSGLTIRLRRPDGYDLSQCEFGDGEGVDSSLACAKLASLTCVEWGGDSSADYDRVLDLSIDDFFALTKVVSDTFFRVAKVEL